MTTLEGSRTRPAWARFDIGDTLTWTSQSGGREREKTGKIVAFVPARVSVISIWPNLTNKKFDYDVSEFDRYLIVVPRRRTALATKPEILEYYAPPRQVIDKRGRKVEP